MGTGVAVTLMCGTPGRGHIIARYHPRILHGSMLTVSDALPPYPTI